MLLGLDFDNTLVSYDKLFHKLAIEKGIIDENFLIDKIAIRDHLRESGRDELFTLLQGEVYGLRILEAEPAEGMVEALCKLRERGIEMVLVSHKTKTPYKGPKYELRKAAWGWLEKYRFFAEDGLGWEENQVYFEDNKEDKIRRIISLGCTHYIDDLPEILEMLPDRIKRILYSNGKQYNQEKTINMDHWSEAEIVLKTK